MNVHAILSMKGSDVATIGPDATIDEAAAALRDRKVGALVVSTDGSQIGGILSERDIVRALAERGAATLQDTVASTMSSEVVTCRAADTVHELMGMMTGQRIRHLPVVDDDGALAGIVSIGDVVKHRVSELEGLNADLQSYVSGTW